MSQSCASAQLSSDTLQQLQMENIQLQQYLNAQKAVILSLERRAGRSLEALGVQLQDLTSCQNAESWQSYLQSMQSEVNSLRDLLSDTLVLQKLEAGKVQVKLEWHPLQPLLTDLTRHLLDPKNGCTVRLICKVQSDLPPALFDTELTEAVITDLLARGLKYSDTDTPAVLEAEHVGDRIQIRITVQRFAPPGNRDFATEIALCCRRIEVQKGEIQCQPCPNGLQTVTISLLAASDRME